MTEDGQGEYIISDAELNKKLNKEFKKITDDEDSVLVIRVMSVGVSGKIHTKIISWKVDQC